MSGVPDSTFLCAADCPDWIDLGFPVRPSARGLRRDTALRERLELAGPGQLPRPRRHGRVRDYSRSITTTGGAFGSGTITRRGS